MGGGEWVLFGNTLCTLCMLCYLPSHHALEHEATAESSAIQEQLEVTEALLAEKERELTEAREKVTSLSEELVVSERSVSMRCEEVGVCGVAKFNWNGLLRVPEEDCISRVDYRIELSNFHSVTCQYIFTQSHPNLCLMCLVHYQGSSPAFVA